jgi:hypothetical protein
MSEDLSEELDDKRSEINQHMRIVIDEGLKTIEGRSARELAEKLLVEIDWDLLTAWLFVNRTDFVRDAIDARLRSLRGQARYSSRSVFGDLARRKAAGEDVKMVDHFKLVFEIDPKHTRKTVAEMTGADHRYVASQYESNSKRTALLAAFHRVVAKKVGNKKTAEVIDLDTYDRLFRSIVKE